VRFHGRVQSPDRTRRVARLVAVLSRQPRGCSIQHLARATRRSRATTYRDLDLLRESGYALRVETLNGEARYSIAASALSIVSGLPNSTADAPRSRGLLATSLAPRNAAPADPPREPNRKQNPHRQEQREGSVAAERRARCSEQQRRKRPYRTEARHGAKKYARPAAKRAPPPHGADPAQVTAEGRERRARDPEEQRRANSEVVFAARRGQAGQKMKCFVDADHGNAERKAEQRGKEHQRYARGRLHGTCQKIALSDRS
jgi:hypothetical protein